MTDPKLPDIPQPAGVLLNLSAAQLDRQIVYNARVLRKVTALRAKVASDWPTLLPAVDELYALVLEISAALVDARSFVAAKSQFKRTAKIKPPTLNEGEQNG